MNNTRLSYPDSVVLPTFVTNGSLDGMRSCLQFCMDSSTCGGMVWMAPYLLTLANSSETANMPS